MVTTMTPAEAAKLFKNVKVQVATPTKIRGEDGKERPGYKTEAVPLVEKHITGARDYDGRVVITTIDGQKHGARA